MTVATETGTRNGGVPRTTTKAMRIAQMRVTDAEEAKQPNVEGEEPVHSAPHLGLHRAITGGGAMARPTLPALPEAAAA